MCVCVSKACLEASGTRGGIVMLWDGRIWKGEVLETGTYTFTCKFESQLQDFSCLCTQLLCGKKTSIGRNCLY